MIKRRNLIHEQVESPDFTEKVAYIEIFCRKRLTNSEIYPACDGICMTCDYFKSLFSAFAPEGIADFSPWGIFVPFGKSEPGALEFADFISEHGGWVGNNEIGERALARLAEKRISNKLNNFGN